MKYTNKGMTLLWAAKMTELNTSESKSNCGRTVSEGRVEQMSNEISKSDYERLVEIHASMGDMMEDARRILSRVGGIEHSRARSYWLAHIETALNKDTRYDGNSTYTMEDTLRALDPGDNTNKDDED